MHDASLLPVRLAPDAVRARLAEAVRAAMVRPEPIVRAEVPVAPQDPLAWLRAQRDPNRVYWHGRGESAAEAGVGVADVVTCGALAELGAELGPCLSDLPPEARYYGAARFDLAGEASAEWQPFGRIRFVLPRAVLRVEGDRAWLALHIRPRRDDLDVLLGALAGLRFPGGGSAHETPSLPIARVDAPGRGAWETTIRWALGQFRAGALEKVVLARRARFRFVEPVDTYALLGTLQAATPLCHHGLIGVGQGTPEAAAFVTASPERLLRIEGRKVDTEAVAGTRPRAEDAPGDRRLRDELLASEKDRREHAFVRDAVLAALGPLTASLTTDDETSALTLARGRHLYAGVRGTLRPDATVFDVLAALHPTPAVGGTPREAARAAIAEREPFDRGLYAGPVGWIGRDGADLAVGIRSGLVRGAVLDLFSGAGIVAGSDPAAEWDEIEHKIGDFLRVLGVGDAG